MAEEGPELVRFKGGEEVIRNHKTHANVRDAEIAPLNVFRSNICSGRFDRSDDLANRV